MQADTLNLSCDTVQLKTAFLRYFHGADAELLLDLVEQLAVLHVFDVCRI